MQTNGSAAGIKSAQIITVAFSPDGTRLVSGNGRGWITVRTADETRIGQPFLPHNAVQLATEGLSAVNAEHASAEVFERELANAIRCCTHYPSFRSWTIRSIAEFRLNRYDRAIEALQEARRLEPIQYGEPDVRPLIEGYLAMAAAKAGQPDLAASVRSVFDQKSQNSLWLEDERVQRSITEVAAVFSE